MTVKELARLLDGRKYGYVITDEEQAEAKTAGLVVAYGYSDDLLEFEGAICDEVGAYRGATAYLKKGELIPEPSCGVEADECKLYQEFLSTAHKMTTVWHNGSGPCWTILTDIPHETFNIIEDGETVSVGIVFRAEDAMDKPAPPPSYWAWFEETISNPNAYEWEYGWRCSKCKSVLPDEYDDPGVPPEFLYCPFCGEKMDAEIAKAQADNYIASLEKQTGETSNE